MRALLLFPLLFMLYACPYESNVALEQAPVEPVDSTLLGYWYGIIKDGSDFFGIEALDISRLSDSTYSITRYGKTIKADMVVPDTAHFTGYTSRINDQLFMNVEGSLVLITTQKKKGPVVNTRKVYYISSFTLRHDTLLVKTVSDNFSPAARKGFSKSEQLKEELSNLIKEGRNIYDDIFTLSYRKIARPPAEKSF